MGCTLCREDGAIQIDADCIIPFERKLEFHRLQSTIIDKVLFRHSKFFRMTEAQLISAFKDLSIDIDLNKNFYIRFHNGNYFSTQRLNVLGIMIGRGKDEEKIPLLFRNYDKDTSGTLSQVEVDQMVLDCINVACLIIPSTVSAENFENKMLQDYANRLKCLVKGLSVHFNQLILGNSNQIDLDQFKEIFKEDTLRCLIDPKKMRQYAIKIYSEIISSSKIIMQVMEDQNYKDSQVIKRLEQSRKFVNRSSITRKPKRKAKTTKSVI
jgi:Ca2+-binding EF-hand superfamily protein